MYKYFDEKTTRDEILKKFIEEKIISTGKLLFVFGKVLWDKAQRVLSNIEFKNEFDDWNKKKNGKPSLIKWSENKAIWLTGHPSYGWINEEVIEKIKSIRIDKV